MTERTLYIIPESDVHIERVGGGPVKPGILNNAQWGDAFSWERPNNLSFTFGEKPTALTFQDSDGILTDDPVVKSKVVDQQLSQPVTVNGTTFKPNSETIRWENPPPVYVEHEYQVTLFDDAGHSYRMVGVSITEGYTSRVVGVAFDGPAPPPGTTLYYYQRKSDYQSGGSMVIPDIVPCFLAGTLIETPAGPRPIEDLRVGDEVLTLDHGPQPIRWIGRSRVCGLGELAPIRFAAGALGNSRDLLVSANHRIFLRSAWADLHFGSNEVLVAAKFLVDGAAIRPEPMPVADYLHLMLDEHEIVFAEGAAAESLLAGPMALRAMDPEARAELLAIFPELAEGPGPLSRQGLNRRESLLLGTGGSAQGLPLVWADRTCQNENLGN